MQSKKGFVKQQDESDCGVACLLSIIKYYDGNNSLETIRNLSGTNVTGTTLLGLCQAASKIGFTAEGCEADIPALLNHPDPLILHVIVEDNLQHYIICYGTINLKNKLNFVIGDPAKGIICLTQNEVEKIWQSKSCLTLTPNDSFKKASDVKKEKQRWIKALIKEDSTLLGMAAVIGVAMAALGMAMAVFSQRLIDDILPHKNFTKLYLGIILLIVLLLVKEGFSVLRQYFLITQSRQFNVRIINFFYSHLLNLPKTFFDTRKIGDLTARLNDTTRIQRVINQIAGNFAIDFLITLVSLVFLFTYSWKAALISIAALPFYFTLIYTKRKKIAKGQQNIMQGYALSEANYISTLQGIEPIKNYNKQLLFSDTNNLLYKNYQDKIFLFGKIQIKLSLLANVFGVFFLIGILFFTASEVLHNHLKTGELIAIVGMCSSLLTSIANLALIAIPVNEAKIAFNRMFEFTGIKPESITVLNNSEPIYFKTLQIQNLGFRFPGRSQLLKNISLHVDKGEIIGMMGENGCGKSTFTQILQSHYQYETGQIIINNRLLLADIPVNSWRQIVGVIPQSIHIFNCSVLENIAFDDAQHKTTQVLNFLNQHGFSSFLDKLPQSYLTLVGEEGINLSGGQKQIIALARALYHNPQLLILDEATSAMDRESEQFVLNLLTQLKKSMAVIFITHRLHILKLFCDRIYLLQNGMITMSGNHTELLKTENLYSNYWKDLR